MKILPKPALNKKRSRASKKNAKASRKVKIPRVSSVICCYNLGLLNVCGMHNKLIELGNTIKKNGSRPMDFLGCNETWENESHNFKLNSHKWIGKPSNRERAGIGFWVNKKLASCCAIPDFLTPHPDILWLQFITKQGVYFLAVFYSQPGEEEERLNAHKAILDCLTQNLVELDGIGLPIILGDSNSDLIKHKNRPRSVEFKNFCSAAKMVPLKDLAIKQSETWSFCGPMGMSTPDHILIPKTEKDSFGNFKINQGISCGSDHRLLSVVLQGGMAQDENIWGTPSQSTTIWEKEEIKIFQDSLLPKIQAINKGLPIEDEDKIGCKRINAIATLTTNALKSALDKIRVIGDGTHKPPLASEGCPQLDKLINRRNKLLNADNHKKDWPAIHSMQSQISSLTKTLLEKRDRQWWSKISKLDQNSNAREYWKLAKNLKKDLDNCFPTFMTNDEENVISSKADIMTHINAYYSDIDKAIDKEAREFCPDGPKGPDDLTDKAFMDNNIENGELAGEPSLTNNKAITYKEVYEAIWKAKNGKAPGCDEITSECLKHGGQALVSWLTRLFNLMFNSGHTPSKWQLATTILIHKKSSKAKIQNYRPITLLNSLFKTWEKIIEARLRTKLELANALSPLQLGSRRKLDTQQAILATSLCIQQARLAGAKLILTHIDLSKAYNRVNRKKLWNKMSNEGIKGKLWNALVSTYSAQAETIKIGATTSVPNKLANGLRQGSVLSPLLFVFYINALIEALANSGTGIKMKGIEKPLPCLMFVDDLEMFSTSMKDFRKQHDIVNEFAKEWDLILNKAKTHIMSTKTSKSLQRWCETRKLKNEPSKHSRYLGAEINPTGATGNAHVSCRIGKCTGMVHYMQKKGLFSGRLPVSTSLHIFATVVVPSLMYGMECMELSNHELARLDFFMANNLAKILYGRPLLGPPEWTIWEAGLFPAKIIISMAMVRLQRRISLLTTQFSITKMLISAIDPIDNFFLCNYNLSEEIWGDKLLTTVKTKPQMSKQDLNKSMNKKALEWFRNSTDDRDPSEHIPSPILLKYDLPCERTLQAPPAQSRNMIYKLRIAVLFPITDLPIQLERCNLCNLNCRMTPEHLMHSCTFPNLREIRDRVNASLKERHASEASWWNDLFQWEQTCYLLGKEWRPQGIVSTDLLTLGIEYASIICSKCPYIFG